MFRDAISDDTMLKVLLDSDNTDFNQSIKDVKLILRESQRKFDSDHYYFEVIRTSSQPIKCHLNRQLISLLDTRGVHERAFMRLQETMILNLIRITQSEKYAFELLQKYHTGTIICQMLNNMILTGFEIKNDPFLRECLISIASMKFRELEVKSRIFVEHGAFLYGVCDETAKLKYGQTYICYNGKVITGRVAVAKNPAFHYGDLRTLEAINVPELRHVENCVVFPVNGDRDHPNECSGSDLDGDLYFVCWDRDLVPRTPNFDAMNYTPEKPEVKDKIELMDIVDFFIKMFKNDQVRYFLLHLLVILCFFLSNVF